MNQALVVARKELRALFHSPVALLFLGAFEVVVLVTFFWVSRFFARNLADVRPLFEWLPLLLVLLTAAVTMRAWAEEKKLGTLEVLLTLPVGTRDLVLGKFLAAMGLVGVALALTLPLPVMVSLLGPLDWGPVVGGYVGAVLLGGLYVSLGLCVSARTDNQVVSLMVTLLVGGALWLVGTDAVADLFGNRVAEVLRAVGTGSRFESLERGVLDARDLVYYVALTAFFLTLNVAFLEVDRLDADRGAGRDRALAWWTLTGLVGANAVAACVWLAPVTALRADLTENGDYSISPITERILGELAEPLVIDGYFSERTHPKLAPLVPQIRDLLAEYEIAGRGKVTVTIRDPNADEALEAEIAEQYGVRSVPFQVDDRHQVSVVNSFFHLVVRYGDEYETLSFDQLIEVEASGDSLEVRLKNPEYDLTRAIKRVTQDFSTLATLLASLPEPARLAFYRTPGTLPPAFAEIAPTVVKVGEDVAGRSGGKLTFEELDPSATPGLAQELLDRYGLRPLAQDLFATDTFYFELVLTMGDKVERLQPRGEVGEADLEQAIEAAVQRMTPGQLTTVGLLTEIPEVPPPNPQIPPQFQPPPPRPDYQGLAQLLADTYQIEPVQLDPESPAVPDPVDVLVVAKPGALSERQRYAIDQYLMRGGRVIAFAAGKKITFDRGSLGVATQPTDLASLLAAYGVTVGTDMLADEQMATFPRPKQVRAGGMTLQRIELDPYPFFVDVRQSGLARGHPAVAGLGGATFPWASPLSVTAKDGTEATVLARTTASAWRYAGTELDPPDPTDARAEEVLAVAITGRIPSAFAEVPNPMLAGEAPEGGDPTVGTVKQSLPDARLAVLGAPEMVSDLLLQLAQGPGGEVHRGNLQLLQNLIDWSVEDTELLTIRSAGAFARTLAPLDDETRNLLELGQVVLALMLVGLVALGQRARRAAVRPIPLPEAR